MVVELSCELIFRLCCALVETFMEWLQVDESFLEKHVDKFDNDWFDKELNFNRERLREAEELRLQQMRIEQEVIVVFNIVLFQNL